MASIDPRELVPITVELFVPDVEASVRFYTEKLGFELMRLERAALLIAHKSLEGGLALPPGGGAVHIRIVVDDVDAMHERARSNGVAIVQGIADRPYGLRDFSLKDPDGFHLRFASPLP